MAVEELHMYRSAKYLIAILIELFRPSIEKFKRTQGGKTKASINCKLKIHFRYTPLSGGLIGNERVGRERGREREREREREQAERQTHRQRQRE